MNSYVVLTILVAIGALAFAGVIAGRKKRRPSIGDGTARRPSTDEEPPADHDPMDYWDDQIGPDGTFDS